MNSKYDNVVKLIEKINSSSVIKKQDVLDAINELNEINKKPFDNALDKKNFMDLREQVKEIREAYLTQLASEKAKVEVDTKAMEEAKKAETARKEQELALEKAKAEAEAKAMGETVATEATKTSRKKFGLKKIVLGLGVACTLFAGLSAIKGCSLQKTDEPVMMTMDDLDIDDSIENTQEQINLLSGMLNNTRAYGNGLGADVMYDAYLVSNADQVFANKDFMASLNYYNATGSKMMVNTINTYRQLSRANSYMAADSNVGMIKFGDMFLNEQDKEFANKIQQMSYDILEYSSKTDADSKVKVESLKKEFNDVLVNSDFETTSNYSDQTKLYALIFADSTHTELKAKYGEGIFTDAIEEKFLNATKECENAAEAGKLEDLTGQTYFKNLHVIENLGDDLRAQANGKVEGKLTRDEIVQQINSKVTVAYKSENELHDIKDYSKEYIGEATVKTDSQGNQTVSAGGNTSGGIVNYPNGVQQEGTKTETIIDTNRGEEVIDEVIIGGDHDKDNDGKVDPGNGAASGEEITINPGGGAYDPNIPMWPEEGIDVPNPGEEIGEPIFVPVDGNDNISNENSGNSEENVHREEVIDEEVIDGPVMEYTSVSPVSYALPEYDDIQAQQDYYASLGFTSTVDEKGVVSPVIVIEDTEDLGKTK